MAPSGAVWTAGDVVEVAWTHKAWHGGGYQYRLCPAGRGLDEDCFQAHPVPFADHTSELRWGGVGITDVCETGGPYHDCRYTSGGGGGARGVKARVVRSPTTPAIKIRLGLHPNPPPQKNTRISLPIPHHHHTHTLSPCPGMSLLSRARFVEFCSTPPTSTATSLSPRVPPGVAARSRGRRGPGRPPVPASSLPAPKAKRVQATTARLSAARVVGPTGQAARPGPSRASAPAGASAISSGLRLWTGFGCPRTSRPGNGYSFTLGLVLTGVLSGPCASRPCS